jgi:hypothetical protein
VDVSSTFLGLLLLFGAGIFVYVCVRVYVESAGMVLERNGYGGRE